MAKSSKEKWKLAYIPVEDIVPAEENANEMTDGDFSHLVKNIGIGGLSSVITCYHRKSDGKYVIISGHHRYEAAVKCSYVSVPCIYAEEEDLTKDEIIATQLSHNSLHGQDNKGILKRMFEEIQSIEFKEFAHIDVAEIDATDLFHTDIVPIAEHFVLSLVLYKNDIKYLENLIGDINGAMATSDLVIIADQNPNEEMLLKLIGEIRKKFDIKSSDVSFNKILVLANKAL